MQFSWLESHTGVDIEVCGIIKEHLDAGDDIQDLPDENIYPRGNLEI